jgi:hypothetical protein
MGKAKPGLNDAKMKWFWLPQMELLQPRNTTRPRLKIQRQK